MEADLAQDSALKLVYREFERYGITDYRLHTNGGKHHRLNWSYRGITNVLTVSKTPSDHRVPLNLLTDLRRQIREANLPLPASKPKNEYPKLVSGKLCENPLEKRVESLAGDVNLLTDLLLDLAPDLSLFAKAANEAEAIEAEAPAKFRFRATIPARLVGPLLAYLSANGVAMSDLGIAPLNTSPPKPAAKEAEPKSFVPVQFPTLPPDKPALPAPVKPSVPPPEKSLFAAPPSPVRPSPVPEAPPVNQRIGRAFADSAICMLMQYLRDHGPKATCQLESEGFETSNGKPVRLTALASSVRAKGFAERTWDGKWALSKEGRAKLKSEGL